MAKGLALKRFAWKRVSPQPIIGVDEVGRGCLAGRVYAAAVVLKSTRDVKFYTDSKLLSEKRREELFESIKTHHDFSIAFATVAEINRLNILWAAMLAMKRAVEGLNLSGGHVLIDGIYRIPRLRKHFLQTPVVKGDLRASPIGAASIVAKVARDQYARELAQRYPMYLFDLHKGYGTPEHHERIQKYGPCPEHRKFFSGVKEFWENEIVGS